jgi:hypothetical protein
MCVAERVFWWNTLHPEGGCPLVIVAVLASGLEDAVSSTKRAGFHGLKKRSELGRPPDWVTPVPTAHPGRVCWCPHDCTVPENWRVEP